MAVRSETAPIKLGGLKLALSVDQTEALRGTWFVVKDVKIFGPSSWRIRSHNMNALMELPTNSFDDEFTATRNSGCVEVAGAHILMACVPGRPWKLASTRSFNVF